MAAIDPITRVLHDVRAEFLADSRGEVATYIPQLSAVPPDLFGMALATLDGRVYHAGESEYPFSIQSISKPFVYALALADHGLESVLDRVGAEPSGEAFNAISLEPDTGRPANPMINAGALVTAALVDGATPDTRFGRILAILSAFAGHDLEVDQAVYRSEMETADRNRALCYLMRGAGSLDADVEETLDVYVRQCAVLATTRDLAVMAATLANGGVNPVTGARVISGQIASHVLTVMGTCGMYDYSGEWLLRVGLPAKSGVSGGVTAVKPAQFGFGLFSPRLDARGNSVRAVGACQALAGRFGLHLLNSHGRAAPATYLATDGRALRSARHRTDAERQRLASDGEAILIRRLQGDLGFAAAEQLLASFRKITAPDDPSPKWCILDLERVGLVHPMASALLRAIVAELAAAGISCLVIDPVDRAIIDGATVVPSIEEALQRSEDALLAAGEA
jgi:glutaminase